MKLTGENQRTRGKTCPSATLSTTNPTWTDLGSNPGLHGGRPVANFLSHGTPLAPVLGEQQVTPTFSRIFSVLAIRETKYLGWQSVSHMHLPNPSAHCWSGTSVRWWVESSAHSAWACFFNISIKKQDHTLHRHLDVSILLHVAVMPGALIKIIILDNLM
jgi:hypothetical protein